jgi:hypothetical protein
VTSKRRKTLRSGERGGTWPTRTRSRSRIILSWMARESMETYPRAPFPPTSPLPLLFFSPTPTANYTNKILTINVNGRLTALRKQMLTDFLHLHDINFAMLQEVTHPHFVEIPAEARFLAHVQTGPGAHPASCARGTGSFPGVKRPGRGADHPPPPSAEVENE